MRKKYIIKRALYLILILVFPLTVKAVHVKKDGLWYDADIYGSTARVIMSQEDKDYSGSLSICSSVICRSKSYRVTSIDVSAFSGCSGLTSIIIPSSVTSIGRRAFNGCSGLTSITIPNSVTTIGDCAFQSCYRLTSVTIDKDMPISICSDTFSEPVNATLYVPYGSKPAYEAAAYWKEFKEIIEIDDSQEQPAKGDVNGDGKASITDIVLIIDVIAGTITDADQVAAADVNGDGSVSITDCVAAIDLIAAQSGAGSRMTNVNE